MHWLWLVIDWLVMADWLAVDLNWAVLVWGLDMLILVLEDGLVAWLVVSISVAVEGLHESLGFVVLCLEEGVT